MSETCIAAHNYAGAYGTIAVAPAIFSFFLVALQVAPYLPIIYRHYQNNISEIIANLLVSSGLSPSIIIGSLY